MDYTNYLHILYMKTTQDLPPLPPPSVTSTITQEQQNIIDDLTALSNTIIAREAEIMALKNKWANNDYTLPEDETNENRLRFLSHITKLTNPQFNDLETLLDRFDENDFIENIGGHNRTYYAEISRRLDMTRQLLHKLKEPVRIFQEEIEPLMVQMKNKNENTSYTLKDDNDEDENVDPATFFVMLLDHVNSYKDALRSPIRIANALNSNGSSDPMAGALKVDFDETDTLIGVLNAELEKAQDTTSGGRKRKAKKTKRAKKTKGVKKTKRAKKSKRTKKTKKAKGVKKTKRANNRKTRSNKIKGGNDDEEIAEQIINKVEKTPEPTFTTEEETFISTHLHKEVTEELWLRKEMYEGLIQGQEKKIIDIKKQGGDEDDVNKAEKKLAKLNEIYDPKIINLKEFATRNHIALERGYTDSDTDSDF